MGEDRDRPREGGAGRLAVVQEQQASQGTTEGAASGASGASGGGEIDLLSVLFDWLPFVFWVVVVVGGLALANRLLVRPGLLRQGQMLPRLLAMIVLTVAGLVVMIVALPVDERILTDQTKSNLITLVGLSITAVVTLSSTTLAANGMAGLMLRGVGSFRTGDFVRVGEQFGRVTERGLFHVEIQTEDRDLVTLPNLYLATNPVRVVRSSGTVVSAEVGLGYDTPHGRISELLKRAAADAGLEDPFVWIMELQDHAVRYRVAGMLEEIKTLVSARSRLHASVLDTLHEAGVEIVSPGFAFHRQTDASQRVIPERARSSEGGGDEPESNEPERKVFDKADSAEQRDEMRNELESLRKKIKELEKDGGEDAQSECERLRSRAQDLESKVNGADESGGAPGDGEGERDASRG